MRCRLPLPSEPYVTLARHTAQASHSLHCRCSWAVSQPEFFWRERSFLGAPLCCPIATWSQMTHRPITRAPLAARPVGGGSQFRLWGIPHAAHFSCASSSFHCSLGDSPPPRQPPCGVAILLSSPFWIPGALRRLACASWPLLHPLRIAAILPVGLLSLNGSALSGVLLCRSRELRVGGAFSTPGSRGPRDKMGDSYQLW